MMTGGTGSHLKGAIRLGLLQERLESSEVGRVLISAFLIATLFSLCVTNLPDSRLRREATKATDPYVNSLGLDQTWSVFAPDPRRVSLDMEARITYSNGETATWTVPRGGSLIGSYWDYRWRKWLENVVQEANRGLWRPTAQFIAQRRRRSGSLPTRVTLVRRWRDLTPPGARPRKRPRWQQYAFYTLLTPRTGSR
jgi:hypothetical protein